MDQETQEQQYVIKVRGEAICGLRKDIRSEFYEVEFILPMRGGEALSVIQNRLIKPKLKEKFGDIKSVRTCGIVSERMLDETKAPKKQTIKDLPTMTLEEMSLFVVNAKLKTDPAKFGNIESARAAIQQEVDDIKLAKELAKKKPATKGKPGTKGATTKKVPAKAETDDEFADEVID